MQRTADHAGLALQVGRLCQGPGFAVVDIDVRVQAGIERRDAHEKCLDDLAGRSLARGEKAREVGERKKSEIGIHGFDVRRRSAPSFTERVDSSKRVAACPPTAAVSRYAWRRFLPVPFMSRPFLPNASVLRLLIA